MMRKEFYYPSGDGKNKIHALEWIPDGEVKGILQICHGMAEYVKRYDSLAVFLNSKGYYVVGNDHLGHGESIGSDEDKGFFGIGKGNQYVISDIHALREITKEQYGDVPYFMMGHSMGSFLLRQYLTLHGDGLKGAVIMGTGYQSALTLGLGQMLCRITAAFKGWSYRSRFIDNLSFGGFNKKYEPGETHKEWLNSDAEKCREYVEDSLCGFVFTVNGYEQMFEGMKVLTHKKNIEKVPKSLPILLVSGRDDPVGGFGKAVIKVYREYKRVGIRDVSYKLYDGARHELVAERKSKQIYVDICRWLDKRCI